MRDFIFSKRSLDILNDERLHPDLVRVEKRALELTTVDFGLLCGMREDEEQAELYAQGRTKPGKIVTWTLDSAHKYGHAIDYGVFVDGKYINGDSKEELALYNKVADAHLRAAAELQIPITWGGAWVKNPDSGHVELNKNFYKRKVKKMDKTKSILTSKGVLGALIVIISTAVQAAANHFGFTVGEADLTEAMSIYTQSAQAFGGALALFGRIKATKRIK